MLNILAFLALPLLLCACAPAKIKDSGVVSEDHHFFFREADFQEIIGKRYRLNIQSRYSGGIETYNIALIFNQRDAYQHWLYKVQMAKAGTLVNLQALKAEKRQALQHYTRIV